MIQSEIKLDITARMKERAVIAKQYDNMSRKLKVFLYNGSFPYTIDHDATITINALKPDGTKVFNTCECAGENVVDIVFTRQMLACAGSVPCDIRITKGEETLSSARFELIVEASPYDEDAILSESEMTEFQKTRGMLENAVESASESAKKASTSETKARDYMNFAESAQNKAETSKKAAEKAEAAAESSEEDARASAGKAELMRNEAREFRDAAAGYAGAATYSFMTDADGYICLNYKED